MPGAAAEEACREAVFCSRWPGLSLCQASHLTTLPPSGGTGVLHLALAPHDCQSSEHSQHLHRKRGKASAYAGPLDRDCRTCALRRP